MLLVVAVASLVDSLVACRCRLLVRLVVAVVIVAFNLFQNVVTSIEVARTSRMNSVLGVLIPLKWC